jgi:hypothetical protein
MERPYFVRKSMPSKGVVTAAHKKSNLKICPEKQTENWRNPQAGLSLLLAPPGEGRGGLCGSVQQNG